MHGESDDWSCGVGYIIEHAYKGSLAPRVFTMRSSRVSMEDGGGWGEMICRLVLKASSRDDLVDETRLC